MNITIGGKLELLLLNSFPREIAETLFLGWSKKDLKYSGEDIETDIAEKFDSFEKMRERYDGLNMP